MKISEAWLREWVNPDISTQELVDQLTMAGLEVDSVEAVAGEFDDVVVGEILAVEPHPDADKLRVCRVAGAPDGEAQVVCGAPNARIGIKVPYALVGAVLPGGGKIKKAKLRGVESFGMLCSQTELQAGDDDSGLWELPADAPTGSGLEDYLSLNDQIIEIDLTPNRGDCLSIRGLAREVGVLNKCPVRPPALAPVSAAIDDTQRVTLEADRACPRYVGRVIRNIDISRPSPLWLQEKLRRCGLRSIDAVVDVTNYILLEQGQPMHAFDHNKLTGGILVRMAQQGEEIALLNGQELALSDDTLVIADDSGAIAMAGIMGGSKTAVGETTHDIFLESAFFDPLAIAGRARRYGLHTDSSHRFERGVDYAGAETALERATALLIDIVGGEPGPTQVTDSEHLPQPAQVFLNRARVHKGLGVVIEDDEIEDVLKRLGFGQNVKDNEGWHYEVPSYRFDVRIEEDLFEELARIHGYNHIPNKSLEIAAIPGNQPEQRLQLAQLAQHLTSRGYQEVVTYSFVDPKIESLFNAGQNSIELLNPISADMAVMRTSLLPGLVETLRHNINRQKDRVRIFEAGLQFERVEGDIVQTPILAGLAYGPRLPLAWEGSKEDVDYYDLKGDIEGLLTMTTKTFTFSPADIDALHPGQSAKIDMDGQTIGFVGALHPELSKQLELPKPAYVFSIALDAVLETRIPRFQPLSNQPEVHRDLAVLVARETPVIELEKCITGAAGAHLKNLKVFDVYSGEGIDPQRKSVAFNLTFQHPSRTLKEEEINKSMASIVKRLEDELDARLR